MTPTEPSAQSSLAFPTNPSTSSSTKSKLTSSDKLTELPTSAVEGSGPASSSYNARSFRRSLDSLPSTATNDSGPRISQVWGTISNIRSVAQQSLADASLGNDTPKQRVSFESERPKVPRPTSPDAARNSAIISQPRSRASSPLRIFQHLSAGFHRRAPEEPFIPINPFAFKFSRRIHLHIPSWRRQTKPTSPPSPSPAGISHSPDKDSLKTRTFLTDTLPRQIYLHILLRLPALYFSRVARIFQDAEVSRPDIQRMVDSVGANTVQTYELDDILTNNASPSQGASARTSIAESRLPMPDDWTPALVSPALIRFKHSWEDFVTSLIKEWKTLNVVSALFLSAILTLLQLPSASNDPITRTTALLSLVCALMSLCYGCMYIVRFATMRNMYRASKFAEEARKTYTFIWWNVWTLLAMPAVFLAWSVIFFILSITAFVWRSAPDSSSEFTRPSNANINLGNGNEEPLIQRILITFILFLGLLYFALIVVSLTRYTGGASIRARTRNNPSDPEQARAEQEERERGRSARRSGVVDPAMQSSKSAMDSASPIIGR
ncbi:hypothetical protein C8F01DRAFT_1172776 [Mycena amicta]|nr:hypothetical protein C8F01DRAFT_1172776 [Mycena amicta]